MRILPHGPDRSVIVSAEDRTGLAAIIGDRSRPLKHERRATIVLHSADRAGNGRGSGAPAGRQPSGGMALAAALRRGRGRAVAARSERGARRLCPRRGWPRPWDRPAPNRRERSPTGPAGPWARPPTFDKQIPTQSPSSGPDRRRYSRQLQRLPVPFVGISALEPWPSKGGGGVVILTLGMVANRGMSS